MAGCPFSVPGRRGLLHRWDRAKQRYPHPKRVVFQGIGVMNDEQMNLMKIMEGNPVVLWAPLVLMTERQHHQNPAPDRSSFEDFPWL